MYDLYTKPSKKQGLVSMAAMTGFLFLHNTAQAYVPVDRLNRTSFFSLLDIFGGNEKKEPLLEYSDKDVDCLATNIYFEARGETTEGKEAVAYVTINRVLSGYYPDSVCKVVYQAKYNKHGKPLRNQCQFSWYCDGRPDKIKDYEIYEECKEVALDVLNNNCEDKTKGAINYHSISVWPKWANKEYKTALIGAHVFYNPAIS